MLPIRPRVGELGRPFSGAVIVDHLLLRRRHGRIGLRIHQPLEHHRVERGLHMVLGDLVDAEHPLIMSIKWKSHDKSSWFADVDGIGRYLIRRRVSGSREFVLLLDDKSTKYYGTVVELKKIVERIVASRQPAAAASRR